MHLHQNNQSDFQTSSMGVKDSQIQTARWSGRLHLSVCQSGQHTGLSVRRVIQEARLLLCNLVAVLLFRCLAVLLCGCVAVLLCGCVAVWPYVCVAVWLYDCLAVWLYDCMAVWLCYCVGCDDVWLHGFMAA